jgi:S-formylglutathione hydrolase FrmB
VPLPHFCGAVHQSADFSAWLSQSVQMKRRTAVVAGALVLSLLSLLATGVAVVIAHQPALSAAVSPAETVAVNCSAPSLGGKLPALVYLPAGYRSGPLRYPVVYFLHGLPAGTNTYTTLAFVADAIASTGRPAIVVAPQGSRSAGSDREYLDWSPTENWPAAISRDLPRCIDRSFRTIASRRGRALLGLSAGGYGAFNIGLRNLATFSAVESWSGYFEATDPTGDSKLDLGSSEANEMARVPRGPDLKARLARWPTLIAFYVGREDTRFLEDDHDFDQALSAQKIRHLFRTYPGGHWWALWRAEAPEWLGYALAQMDQPRK